MGQGEGNEMGLCSLCFGPLYVAMYDPEGKALKRRVERRYLTQLLTGCNKSWCLNRYCKAGRKNSGIAVEGDVIGTKEAIPMVKPFVDGLRELQRPLHFCVDEGSQKRRALAEMLAAGGGGGGVEANGVGAGNGAYELEWCVAALEAEGADIDKAVVWLKNWAPLKSETR